MPAISQLLQKALIGGFWSRLAWPKNKTLSPKQPKQKGLEACASGRVQKALSSNSSTAKKECRYAYM
jgi:hypothetical protein